MAYIKMVVKQFLRKKENEIHITTYKFYMKNNVYILIF